MKPWRLKGILGLIALLYIALGWNIFTIQIKEGAVYLERAEAREDGETAPLARRGRIFARDRSGNVAPVVLNKEFPVAFAVPKEIKDPESVAAQVALVLNLDQESLASILAKPHDP